LGDTGRTGKTQQSAANDRPSILILRNSRAEQRPASRMERSALPVGRPGKLA
jgi:hypothetical protein